MTELADVIKNASCMFNVLKILKENLNIMKNETVKTMVNVMKNEANLSVPDQRRLKEP